MKRFTVLILIVTLLLGIFPSISQAALPLDAQSLKKKYNLKSISKVPCAALAQKFKTTTEVDNAIRKIKSSFKFNTPTVPKAAPAPANPIQKTIKCSQKYSKRITYATLNMLVTYTKVVDAKGNSTFGEILDVKTYILGPTICLKWIPIDYDYLVDGNKLYVCEYEIVEVSFEYKGLPFSCPIETRFPVLFKI